MTLFKETKIGNLTVKNHFIRSATYEGKATEDGRPTDEIKHQYVELAKGDVGTIITSYAYITPYEQPTKNQLGIYDDSLIPDYAKIVDAVHAYGTKIIMQIVHGSSIGQGYIETATVLGPSAITHPTSQITPQEMTKEDIKNVVHYFALAAKRAKSAGFDGVQIHCAHGYLLSQFISPLFNHRHDQYGGNTENRSRIVLEVYQAIREEVGEDYPIWIKINSSDEQEGGLSVEEFINIATKLSNAGMNAIEVSGNQLKKHKPQERAYYKDAAVRLSQVISTPVILTGGLRELKDIQPIYETSHVHFFGFSRPFIKDATFIKRLQTQI